MDNALKSHKFVYDAKNERNNRNDQPVIMTHKTSLTPHLCFIEVSVPSQMNDQLCVYVLGVCAIFCFSFYFNILAAPSQQSFVCL